jgi:hypothetical protein
MASKSEKLPLDDLSRLLALAAECDRAAVTLSTSVKLLYDNVSAIKMRNAGRGPSGATVANMLERIVAKYFSNSRIINVRRGIHPTASTFHAAVSSWLASLSTPAPLHPVSPPAPPPSPPREREAA